MVSGVVDADVRSAVAAVPDPEMPMLTLEDLGVLRSVSVSDGVAVVTLTPSPALRVSITRRR